MHPAPEIPARFVGTEDLPTGARKLLEAAQRWGWTVGATHARGTDLDSSGAPRERTVRRAVDDPEQAGKRHEIVKTGEHVVVDSYAVRMQRAGEALAGVWVAGEYAYGMDRHGVRFTTSTALLERVVGTLHAYPVAARDLALAVESAMRPRKLKAGTSTRSHRAACEHVAARYGLTLRELAQALESVDALPAG